MIPKRFPKIEKSSKSNKNPKKNRPEPTENTKGTGGEMPTNLSTSLPKSQYDNNGRPVLNVDGLDDTDLSSQIGRFL